MPVPVLPNAGCMVQHCMWETVLQVTCASASSVSTTVSMGALAVLVPVVLQQHGKCIHSSCPFPAAPAAPLLSSFCTSTHLPPPSPPPAGQRERQPAAGAGGGHTGVTQAAGGAAGGNVARSGRGPGPSEPRAELPAQQRLAVPHWQRQQQGRGAAAWAADDVQRVRQLCYRPCCRGGGQWQGGGRGPGHAAGESRPAGAAAGWWPQLLQTLHSAGAMWSWMHPALLLPGIQLPTSDLEAAMCMGCCKLQCPSW